MEWKHKAFRSRGRLKMKREDDVKHDLKVMEVWLWKKQAEIRNE
jgi:hypothetical protein